MKLNLKKYIAAAMIILLTSCAADVQSENYDFAATSPLTLTSVNHQHGFLKSSCFNCHLPQNIHRTDHLHDPSFQFAEPLVAQKGLLSCRGCHGTNGVPQ